jgi:hypothetical protein
MSVSATSMRQKPSDKSILANMMMVSSTGTKAIKLKSQGRTHPNSLMGYACNCLRVVLRIYRWCCLVGLGELWCTNLFLQVASGVLVLQRIGKLAIGLGSTPPVESPQVAGEILSCGGHRVCISDHVTISEKDKKNNPIIQDKLHASPLCNICFLVPGPGVCINKRGDDK